MTAGFGNPAGAAGVIIFSGSLTHRQGTPPAVPLQKCFPKFSFFLNGFVIGIFKDKFRRVVRKQVRNV